MARRKMKDIVTKRLKIYQERNAEFPARIGNLATGEIQVSGTSRTIYVTMQTSGAVNQAVNNVVPLALGRPVIVGYESGDMTRTLRVLRAWNAFGAGENDADGLPNHAEQHEWGGADPVYVWWEQVLKSLPVPVPGALSIKVYPGEYRISGGWATFTQRTTVDLSSYVPVTAGKAKYVLVVVNAAGSFAVRDGSEVTGYDTLADTDIPEPTAGDTAICAVKMFTGQTEFRMTVDGPQDIVDLRGSGASGGSTSGAYVRLIGDTMTGELGLPSIQFDTTGIVTPNVEGVMSWNPDDGTVQIGLPGGNVVNQLGQEVMLPRRVKNNTGSNMTNGQLVYISGGDGTNAYVELAKADAEATSAQTIAMLTESITAGGKGYATTFGLVRDVNTAAYAPGTVLYLSPTTAGGYTGTKPTAPNHMVSIGTCFRQHASEGMILININNGYELSELHDVLVTTPTAGQALVYNGTLWENALPTASIMVQESLTSQIDGVATSFTISHAAIVAWLYVNGRLQPSQMTSTTTADLTFAPASPDEMYALYQVNETDILTDDAGLILTDDNGSTLFVG